MSATLLAAITGCLDTSYADGAAPTEWSAPLPPQVEADRETTAAASVASQRDCTAADALQRGCTPPESGTFRPTPDVAGKDYRGNGAKEGCWTPLNFKKFRSCTFGSKNAKYTVALVGNSHMAQYLKSFTGWTRKDDLRVVTFLIPQCFATNTKIDFSGRKGARGLSERCHEWGQWARKEAAALKPDLIVTSERTYRQPVEELPEGRDATWRKGYRDYLAGWVDAGRRVAVIRDNPVPKFDVPRCLEKNPRKFSECSGKRSAWVLPDPLVQAARSLDSALVEIIDLNDYMCTEKRCPAVIADTSVYRDHSHLSGTWVAELEPFMRKVFLKVLRD